MEVEVVGAEPVGFVTKEIIVVNKGVAVEEVTFVSALIGMVRIIK